MDRVVTFFVGKGKRGMETGYDNDAPVPPPIALPPSFARPMSDGLLDPALVIEHDMCCVQCNYNLRTRRMCDHCPECGAPVRMSFVEPGPGPSENLYASNRSANITLTMGILSLALGFNTWGVGALVFGPLGIGFYFKYKADVRNGLANHSPRTRRIARAGLICSSIALGLVFVALMILLAVLYL